MNDIFISTVEISGTFFKLLKEPQKHCTKQLESYFNAIWYKCQNFSHICRPQTMK